MSLTQLREEIESYQRPPINQSPVARQQKVHDALKPDDSRQKNRMVEEQDAPKEPEPTKPVKTRSAKPKSNGVFDLFADQNL